MSPTYFGVITWSYFHEPTISQKQPPEVESPSHRCILVNRTQEPPDFLCYTATGYRPIEKRYTQYRQGTFSQEIPYLRVLVVVLFMDYQMTFAFFSGRSWPFPGLRANQATLFDVLQQCSRAVWWRFEAQLPYSSRILYIYELNTDEMTL